MVITKAISVALLALAFIGLPSQQQVTLSNGGVRANNPQVNVETNLIFQISSSPILQTGWVIRIDWPSQVTQLSTSPNCTTFFVTQSQAPCTYTAGNTYAETQVTDNSELAYVTISNFRTPSSTKPTDPFTITVTDSGGTQQGSYTNSFFILTTSTPNVFQTATMIATASPARVADSGPVELTLTPTTEIPASGRIVIVMPEWNPTSNSPESMLSSSTTCTGTQGVGSSLSCSVSSHTLTISNVVDSASSSQIKITVTNVHYSLTTGGTTGIRVTSYTADGAYMIDRTTTMALSGINTAATLTLANTGFNVASSATVGEIGSATFQFRVPVPVAINCKFNIKFPLQMSVDSTSTTVGVNYISFPREQIGLYSAPKSSGQARDIYLNYVCPDNYVEANQNAIFTISSVRNPSSTKITDTFQIYLLDGSDNKIAELTTGLTWQAAAGSITGLALNLVPGTVKASATATVSFTPTHTIPTSGKLEISFPSDVSPVAADTSSCSLTNTQEVQSSASCEITGQILSITNPFFAQSVGAFIKFSVATIVGPASVKPVEAMTVRTYESATDAATLIDTNSASSLFTATPGSMTQSSAGPQSAADKSTYLIVTYLFSMKPQNNIPQGGYLQVSLPSDDSLMAVINGSINICASVSGFITAINCEVDSTTQFRIINGFTSGGFSTDGTQDLSFRMNGIRNPRSFKQTTSFTYTTFDSGNYKIDERSTGITSVMTIASNLHNAEFATSSEQNAATATYTFTLTPRSPLLATDVLKVTCPPEVTKPPNPTTCSVAGNSISGGCSVIGSVITVPNLLVAAEGAAFNVAIDGFTNPPTTKPTSTFTITIQDSAGNQISGYDGTLVLKTSIPRVISDASLAQSVTTAFTASDYTFQFRTLSQLGTDNELQLLFPSQLTLPATISCLGNQNIVLTDANCAKEGDHIVNIKNGFQGTIATGQTVKFTITGITNSRFAADTDSITITIKDSLGYELDQVQGVLPAIADCNYPCFTCTDRLTAPSTCTACNPAWTEKLLQGNECRSSCSQQWRQVDNTQCEQCNAKCLECETHKDVCSKCGLPDYPVWVSNDCLASCSSGFYSTPDNTRGNICAPCDLPCDTCTSQTQCLTCSQDASNPQKLFQSPECVASCTPQTYVQIGNVCEPCSTNCKTCSTSVTNCESCNPGWLFLNNVCYQTNCPDGYYADGSGNNCLQCDQSCNTCTGTASHCTSCSGSLFLNNNQCIAQCPNTKYGEDNLCKDCTGDCVECTSLGYCTVCTSASGGLAYKGACFATCPVNVSVQDGSNCVDCDSSCNTCVTTRTTCTSCLGTQVLFNGQCLNSCPSGSTLNNDGVSCSSCNNECITCDGTPSYCTQCKGNSFAYLGSCSTTCPSTNQNAVALVGVNGICEECNANCKTCQISTTQCSSCAPGWLLKEDQTCENASGCVSGQYFFNGECVLEGQCGTNYAKNGFGTCVSLADENLVWFPMLISTLVLLSVALISKCVNRDSLLITNFVFLMGGLELILYLMLLIQAFLWGSTIIGVLVLFALLALIALDLLWWLLCYKKKLPRDQGFQIWIRRYKCTAKTIMVLSTVINLKISRLFYSRFFGSDYFFTTVDNPRSFAKPYNHVSWANIISSMLVVICAALIGVASVPWGFQLMMTCIQALIVELLLIILIIIESKTARIFTAKPGEYGILEPTKSDISDGESRMLLLNLDPDTKRKHMRDIINLVRHGKGEAFTDLFQMDTKGIKRRASMPSFPNVEKAPDQKSFSYPTTPKDEARMSKVPDFTVWGAAVPSALLPDNVMAESRPPNPLKSNVLTLASGTQTNKSTIRKMKEQSRFFETKNFYFQDQISDAEISDDELAIIMEESEVEDRDDIEMYVDPETGQLRKKRSVASGPVFNAGATLKGISAFGEGEDTISPSKQTLAVGEEQYGVMKEEGQDASSIGEALPEDGGVSQREGNTTDRPISKVPEEALEVAALTKTPSGEKLATGVFKNVYDQFSESEDPTSLRPEKRQMPGDLKLLFKPNTPEEQPGGDMSAMLIPRDPQSMRKHEQMRKTFNFDTGAIRGVFDRDNKGNIVILRNPEGNLVDKQGRRVNRKGYLIDEKGNVVDRDQKIIFRNNQLDSDDQIPGFYTIDELDQYDEQLLRELENESDYPVEDKQTTEQNDDELIENELRRLKDGDDHSAHSSVNENMDISPVQYNLMNQRNQSPKPGTAGPGVSRPDIQKPKAHTRDASFGPGMFEGALGHSSEHVQDEYEDVDGSQLPRLMGQTSGFGMRDYSSRKKKRPQRKKMINQYLPPKESDFQLAKAYGGKARGHKLRKIVPEKPNSLTQSQSGSVRGFYFPPMHQVKNDDTQSKLFNIVDSISGYGEDRSIRRSSSKKPRAGSGAPRRFKHSGNRPTTESGQYMMSYKNSKQRLHERMEEIKRDPFRDTSLLDESSYYGPMGRGGGTTDSDWQVFAGTTSKRKKVKPKKKKAQQQAARLERVYNNMDLLVNTSEAGEDDNVSQPGSQGSIYSNLSKNTQTGGKRIKGLQAIYLQRLEHKGKRGPGGGGLPAGLLNISGPNSYIPPSTTTAATRKKNFKQFRNLQDRFEYELESQQRNAADQTADTDFYGEKFDRVDRRYFPDGGSSLEIKTPGLAGSNSHHYGVHEDEPTWAIRSAQPHEMTTLS